MASDCPDWLNALADLPSEEVRPAEFFSLHADLRNARTVELLHEQVLAIVYADLARAKRLASAAWKLAGDLGDPAALASGWRALGHVSYAGSQYEEALSHYQKALEIFTALGRDLEAGRTLTSGLQSLIYLGRYEEAYAWAARAKEIFRRHGDELRLARLASNVGNIHYRQDRYAEALAIYEEAYATLVRLGAHRDVAAVLSNMAVCNISLSRFDRALESYRTARDYCERHGLPVLVAGADYNIAYLHYLQGDFLEAIGMYQASREHCRAAGDAYHAALCDLDEAEIYLELNLNAEAMRLAEQAEAGFAALGMPYERAKATVTHAIAASLRGQPRLASRLFLRARNLFAAERNALWPALIDLDQAILLDREGRHRQATRLCHRAHRVLAGSMLPGRAALSELLESRLLLKAGNLSEARQMCDRARTRLEVAGTPSLRFHAYFVEGQVEERRGDPAAAFAAYQSARQEIETLRSRLWSDEPKISFLKDKLAVYESLVTLCLANAGDPACAAAEAFGYIQQAKSRSLAELISLPLTARPSPTAPPPPPAASSRAAGRDREIDLTRRNLNSQYRQMEHLALSPQAASAARMDTLKQAVRDLESRLIRLVAAASSDSLARPTAAANALPLAAIQASIPARAMLLEYYAVRGVLCVCLLDGAGLEIVPLAPVEEIRTRMRLLRFQMRKFRLGPGYQRMAGRNMEQAAETHLRDLYGDLLAPVRDRLEKSGHLIFAPHDFLHHLPFHALRSPDGHLIDEFTVSYAPSATVFARCHVRPPAFGAQSLVFGLPDQLAPHIASEAQTAAAVLPDARLFLGEDATESVLRRLGPSSRFLHIATHGLFRRDNPLFSAIRLGDSHLTLLDLYNLPLTAELVTLSGCSTGLNVVVGGDELLGLMRGLLLAGAQGVMVSLWDVNDRSTSQFMQCFYGRLRDSDDKAAALQVAMRELREEYPHPYYWAPFVLAGKYAPGRTESGQHAPE
jgi:CHAT domain-containing protein/tetratricopeptide (TPR) repeat protein